MYWSTDDDMDIQIVRNCMPRNRYLEIKRFPHFNNNQIISNRVLEKDFKLKPLFERINENFLKLNVFSKQLSVDEQMVRYYGGHFLKQFIRGKPIRFGLKQWVMACGETGFCYQIELYKGKKDPAERDLTTLGEKVITSMVNLLNNPEDHEIYFDNFFSSFRLMSTLRLKRMRATGTARFNRINKCPIKNDDSMKNEPQGAIDYRFDKNNEVLVVSWNDNRCVKVLSNHLTVNPMQSVQRYSKKEKKYIEVLQPYVISQYNKYMGGVDKLDWHVNKYPIKIKGKKWYFRLFTNCLDICMYNSYVIYNTCNERIPYLQFIRMVTRHYLHVNSEFSDPKMLGRPVRIPKECRTITKHVLAGIPDGKQKRCALCKKKFKKDLR